MYVRAVLFGIRRLVSPFQTELAIDVHTTVAGLRRKALPGQENSVCETFCPLTTECLSSPRLKSGQRYRIQRVLSSYNLLIGSPLVNYLPRRPRACFGRGELIEKVVRLAENLEPVALNDLVAIR